jgi:hypothetical protein
VREESEQYHHQVYSSEQRALAESKQVIEDDGKTKKIPLDPRVLDKAICLSTEMAPEEEAELLAFLDKNNDGLHGQPLTLLE